MAAHTACTAVADAAEATTLNSVMSETAILLQEKNEAETRYQEFLIQQARYTKERTEQNRSRNETRGTVANHKYRRYNNKEWKDDIRNENRPQNGERKDNRDFRPRDSSRDNSKKSNDYYYQRNQQRERTPEGIRERERRSSMQKQFEGDVDKLVKEGKIQ